VQKRLREQLRAWREKTNDPLLDGGRLATLVREHATGKTGGNRKEKTHP
jgi:hypothetical protein